MTSSGPKERSCLCYGPMMGKYMVTMSGFLSCGTWCLHRTQIYVISRLAVVQEGPCHNILRHVPNVSQPHLYKELYMKNKRY